MDSLPLSSHARWLTLCMLVSLSREGVVFLVFQPSSHFTEIHVLPPPVSEANWRSLSRPGVSPPPSSSKMASSFTGSAHSPFPGYDTILISTTQDLCSSCLLYALLKVFLSTTYTVWHKLVHFLLYCIILHPHQLEAIFETVTGYELGDKFFWWKK